MVCMCTPVPSGMGPSEGLCAHGVGPESEGVQAGWVPCGQQPLLVLPPLFKCLHELFPCCLPEGLGAKRQRGCG